MKFLSTINSRLGNQPGGSMFLSVPGPFQPKACFFIKPVYVMKKSLPERKLPFTYLTTFSTFPFDSGSAFRQNTGRKCCSFTNDWNFVVSTRSPKFSLDISTLSWSWIILRGFPPKYWNHTASSVSKGRRLKWMNFAGNVKGLLQRSNFHITSVSNRYPFLTEISLRIFPVKVYQAVSHNPDEPCRLSSSRCRIFFPYASGQS